MGRDSDSLMALTVSYSFHLVFLCVALQTRVVLLKIFSDIAWLHRGLSCPTLYCICSIYHGVCLP